MFKISPLLLLAPLALMAASAQAKPAKNSEPKLPASVAAMMPKQALDTATFKLAPAPGAPKLLIHLWCVPRRNPEGGSQFQTSLGSLKSKVTVEEVNALDSLYPTAFTYDIFAPNGKGGWNYLNSIIHAGTSAPSTPMIRYLNNQTKEGLVMELDKSGGKHVFNRTLYVLQSLEGGYPFFTRDFSDIYPPANWGGVRQGFGRDARGYVQLIKAEDGIDLKTQRLFTTRTVFSWDENEGGWKAGDWKAGRPIISERK